MSLELIAETTELAHQDYDCDSCMGLFDSLTEINGRLSSDELAIVEFAQKSKFKIKEGQLYFKQLVKLDGEQYELRSIPGVHQLCCKFDLFDED